MLPESVLALLQTDGVNHRFTLNAFKPGVDNGKIRRINHHRYLRYIRI